MDYAEQVKKSLDEAGIRTELDKRAEKIGYKIREAQTAKIPYMLVVGQKEEEDGTVSVRSREAGDQGAKALDTFIADVTKRSRQRADKPRKQIPQPEGTLPAGLFKGVTDDTGYCTALLS